MGRGILTEDFEAQRERLVGLAYRLLGHVGEAEEVVQDAWLRAVDVQVEHPPAFLRRVVTRLCLDRLGSARRRRESYVGPWLPEPVPTTPPVDLAEVRQDLSLGFLRLLERCSAAERAAFVLRECLDHDYAEVAAVLERSEAACRQLVRRAHQHLHDAPRFEVDPAAHGALLAAFGEASRRGDAAALRALLHDDVVLTSDGGGKAVAARRAIVGSERVARFFAALGAKEGDAVALRPAWLNSQPAVVLTRDGGVDQVLVFDVQAGRVAAVFVVRNPDKLGHVGREPLG